MEDQRNDCAGLEDMSSISKRAHTPPLTKDPLCADRCVHHDKSALLPEQEANLFFFFFFEVQGSGQRREILLGSFLKHESNCKRLGASEKQ